MPVNISQIQKGLSPQPFALVTSSAADGRTNIMALSWWCFASNHPASVIIATSNKGFTGECIRSKKQFALCIPAEGLREAAKSCGTCSGRTVDKSASFGIELKDAQSIEPKVVADSVAVMECTLVSSFTVGDHTAYVGEIVAASFDPDRKSLFAFEGYSRLDTV